MKNHIIFKFIAVLLCAVFLMGAVGSAVGILAMTELNLYNRSYEEAYTEMVEQWADGLAYNIGIRYASGALGSCNTQLLDDYYGTGGYYDMFNMWKVGYTLTDAEGNYLQHQKLDEEPVYTFSFPAGGKYIRLVWEMPLEEWEQRRNAANENAANENAVQYDPQGSVLFDAVPSEGAEVYNVSMNYLDGSGESIGSDEPMGQLFYDDEGWLNCQFGYDFMDRELPATVTHIAFQDEYSNVLFEANDPDGVGEFYRDAAGNLMFRGNLVEMYAPQTEEISDAEMGARAVVNRKTPIWTLMDGEFEKQGYYYGKDYDITIYATRVYEGTLYGCTTKGYLTNAAYRSEWVVLEDVTFVQSPAGSGSGMPAICNNRTQIWALDGSECYDTGMYYQEGQEIGILVLGTLESGEWGLTDLGWVQLSDVTLVKQTAIEYELDSTKAVTDLRTPVYDLPNEDSGVVEYLAKDTEIVILETGTYDGISWGLIGDNWIQMEYVTILPTLAVKEAGDAAYTKVTGDIYADPAGKDIGDIHEGVEFTVLRTETVDGEVWVLMNMGWLREKDIAYVEAMPVATEATADTDVQQVLYTNAEVNVRAMPDAASEALVLLPAGTAVEVQRQEDVNGTLWALTKEGWIQAQYLIPIPEVAEEDDLEPTMAAEPAEAAEEVTEPEVTAAPYQSDSFTEPTLAPEVETAAAEELNYTEYYNHDTDTWMMAGTVYESMPEGYTVEIQLAEGALVYQYEWELFRLLYDYQGDLPKLVIVSLLGLAICVVYLCCAAGRKPGTTEIRAGGLNCIPLDLYICITVGGVFGAVALGLEGVRHFSQNSLQVAVLFALGMAYAAALLIVGFCFAFVAQIKTPGGYWWRNSICGWCLKLVVICWNWFIKGCVWLGRKYDAKLEPMLVRFFKGCWKIVLFFWNLFIKCCKWCYNTLIKCTTWMGNKLVRFFSMLPLTWQWLLTGFAMLFMVAMVFATNGEELLVLICVVGCIAIILYGTHAFGTLLEGVKRMNKGDLDEKVDDKLLIGAFKDFSQELNGLADVAVVAAQKQLKSERMKTELITNVSHDIKTPLTSIINYVDLMQKPHSDEEQEQYLEVLDRQSQRLKKLIDDLMEMSKASTGNLAVDITRVNAGEAINQALGEFADKLEKADLIPVFRQPEKPIEMMADGRLVWRVMSNLLGNAVKYALPGTRVYVDLSEVDGKVIISMKNISREELNVHADELLERFVRGDVSRNTEGSGLGLNIAQSLMELQKGQLQLLVDGDLFKVTLIFPGV